MKHHITLKNQDKGIHRLEEFQQNSPNLEVQPRVFIERQNSSKEQKETRLEVAETTCL